MRDIHIFILVGVVLCAAFIAFATFLEVSCYERGGQPKMANAFAMICEGMTP